MSEQSPKTPLSRQDLVDQTDITYAQALRMNNFEVTEAFQNLNKEEKSPEKTKNQPSPTSADNDPLGFRKLEEDTKHFQEMKYMDSLMGPAVGGDDPRSQKRREEVMEYDEYLKNMDATRDERLLGAELPHDKRNPLLRKIEFVSEQIKNIRNNPGDVSAKIAMQDLASKEALRDQLIAEYRKQYNQSPTDTEVLIYGPKTQEEEEASQAELNAPANSNAPYDWAKDPEWPNDEVTLIDPLVVRRTPGGNAPAPVEEMPEDEAERRSWYRRNRNRLLAGVAGLALFVSGIGVGFLLDKDNKDNQRSGSPTKTEQPAKPNGENPAGDDFMKKFKVNEAFAHSDNKTGRGFEKGDSAKEATEQLKKNFNHHPTLLAEAVYAYQHGIGVDEARTHVDEINKMAKSFIDGDHLSSEGQKWATKLGKSVDNGSARWVTQDEMNSGIWYNSGIEENGKFDKFFINPNAGFNSNKILRVTLGNGKVIYLKYDCKNMLWKDQVEEVSTSTGNGTVKITYDEKQRGTIRFEQPKPEPTNPEVVPPIDDNKRPQEAPQGRDNGDHPAPTPQPTTDQDLGGNTPGGNQTNPEPVQTPRPETPPTPETGTGNGTGPVTPSH